MNGVLVPDGSELFFPAVFGIVVATWTRRVFIAPALWLVVHLGIMVPVFYNDSSRTLTQQLAAGSVVWLSSIAGTCLNRQLNFPKLVSGYYVDRKTDMYNGILAFAFVLTPWSFILGRKFAPVTWSGAPAASLFLLELVLGYCVWKRDTMFPLFPCKKDARKFAFVVGFVYLILISIVWVSDVFFLDTSYNLTIGLMTRIIAIDLVFLTIILSRMICNCLKRQRRKHRELQTTRYLYTENGTHGQLLNLLLGDSSTDASESSEEGRDDDDYVDYASQL